MMMKRNRNECGIKQRKNKTETPGERLAQCDIRHGIVALNE